MRFLLKDNFTLTSFTRFSFTRQKVNNSMATNLVQLDVYQINQSLVTPDSSGNKSVAIAFPSQGVLVRDCITSPTRSLSSGVSVYSAVQIASGDLFFVRQTIAQLVTLFNA
jgi:hypothetical protein